MNATYAHYALCPLVFWTELQDSHHKTDLNTWYKRLTTSTFHRSLPNSKNNLLTQSGSFTKATIHGTSD
jgi:hypothetical protein